MKKEYRDPELTLVLFDDVIITSTPSKETSEDAEIVGSGSDFWDDQTTG